MPITEERYIQLALEAPEGHWELVDGCPRRKPIMTWEHNQIGRELALQLRMQLDRREWVAIHDSGKVRRNARNYFQPDVCVAPMAMARRLFARPGIFEAYPEPLPLVVEVWSPSTGDYDLTDKLAEYQVRGDEDIWLIHPYEHWLTAWRRQSDGSYTEATYHGGIVEPATLPNVRIDLDDLLTHFPG